MKRGAALAAFLALGLSGCILTDLTPQQQASLNTWAHAGYRVVQATATLYCAIEPTTSKIVQAIDTSSGTAKTITKIDSATAVACKAAVNAGIVAGG